MNRQMKVLVGTPNVIFVIGISAVVASGLLQQPVSVHAVGSIVWAAMSLGLFLLVMSLVLLVRSGTMWSRDKIEDMLLGLYAGAPWLLMGSLSSLQSNGINLPDVLGVICGAFVLGWIQIYVKPELKLLDQLDVLKLTREYVKN